jgi:arylsulfatase A-like enzyme
MSIDYLPTILDFCEVKAEPQLQFDGISLKTQLQQRGRTDLSRTLYWQYPHYGNQGGAPGAAVLEDGWKLIEWFDDDRIELFRVYEDISEQQNVAADHPQLVQHLQSRLQAWQLAVGAKRSTVNPVWDPRKKAGR